MIIQIIAAQRYTQKSKGDREMRNKKCALQYGINNGSKIHREIDKE